MAIKNPTEFLVQAVKLPAAIEAKLPAGAPRISTTLLDVAGRLPKVPDLPMELPDLPEPMLPEMPAMPTMPGLRRYVRGVEVIPVGAPASVMAVTAGVTPLVQAYTQPIEGVVGQVVIRRGM